MAKKSVAAKPVAAKKPARSVGSLLTLLKQINTAAPNRSKASDGWVGDAKHASRHSDHNAEPDGTVDARDFTHDKKNGADMRRVCDAIIASKDRRVSYLIFEGEIISGRKGPRPWVKRDYDGANSHHKHLHVSVLDEDQDDTTPWDIAAAFKKLPAKTTTGAAKPATPAKPGMPDGFPKDYQNGQVHEALREVQTLLDSKGYPEVGSLDGRWGTRTASAVFAIRTDNKLTPLTGELDAEFLAALPFLPERKIAPARANATVADLRAEGAEDIQQADQQQIAGGVAAAAPVAVAGMTVLEKAEGYGGFFKRMADIVEPYKDFLVDNAIYILIAVGAFVAYKAYKQKQIRVEKHRLGQDVSR